VPIIFLTAMADAGDRISGLELGGDDYMVKPFEPRELVARIKSVLRRTNMLPPKQQRGHGTVKKLAFDLWVLDLERRELLSPESVFIPLSTADFRLLEVFVRRPNVVLTRDQLLDLTMGRIPSAPRVSVATPTRPWRPATPLARTCAAVPTVASRSTSTHSRIAKTQTMTVMRTRRGTNADAPARPERTLI
jgi:hypothetical protein